MPPSGFPGGSDGGKEFPVYHAGDWVWSLCWEDPLKRKMATYSSILAWRILWTEEPGGLQTMGSQRIRHDWATFSQSVTHSPSTDAAERVSGTPPASWISCWKYWKYFFYFIDKITGFINQGLLSLLVFFFLNHCQQVSLTAALSQIFVKGVKQFLMLPLYLIYSHFWKHTIQCLVKQLMPPVIFHILFYALVDFTMILF